MEEDPPFDVRVYKMARGESLDSRVESLQNALMEFFDGESVEERHCVVDGQEATLFVVDAGAIGLNRVAAGRVEYPSKKSRLAVGFDQTPPDAIDDFDAVQDTLMQKNDFLETVTGRTAEQRKEAMKR